MTSQLARFGVFELDLSTGELSKNGRKLKLQEQPFRLLGLLLDQPGQPVTRDRLKEALWPADTFVDFDHSLNAAVAKLRQALSDSADNPRFIETLARRCYRFIAPVELTHDNSSDVTPVVAATMVPSVSPPPAISPAPASPARKFTIGGASAVAVAIVVVVALALFSVPSWHNAHPDPTTLVQLTSGAGLTMDPAVSPDGKLLAYVSDRAGGRNLNIWIQQLTPAGTEVELTHFDSDTRQPSFSPDGSRIVFHSTDNGGGIYAIPTIGGEPTRLAPRGRNPVFSPDGKWIVYWTGIPNKPAVTGGEGGELYLLPASGGQPRRLAANLLHAGNPVWSPDSARIIVFSPTVGDDFDWFVISLKEEPAIRTSLCATLKRQGFSIGLNRVPHLSQWTPGFILFSAMYGDAFNVWRMPVSGQGRSLGPPERLTSGTTLEAYGLLTPSKNLIFASLNLVQSIWSLPLDADRARPTGELKKLTEGPTGAQPSISLDGRKLAFVVSKNARPTAQLPAPEQQSTFQVRVRDLSTGKEASLPDAGPLQLHPQISRDGTLVSFTTGDRIQIFRIDRQPPRLYVEAEKGSGKIWDWSADNKRLLIGKYPQPNIYEHDVSSQRDSMFLPGNALYQAKFSPDNRAVVLVDCHSAAAGCRLFVVPLKSDGTPEKEHWIAIDHPSHWDDKPRWSPDGNVVYFVSDRDGQFCLWAQRLENRTKQPVGKPLAIYHFHDSRLAMDNVGTSFLEIDVARDKIVMGLGELTGNIWSLRK